jgi:PAS domain-containing protein
MEIADFHELTRGLSEACLILDREGGICAANPAAAELLNRPAEELVGGKLSDLVANEEGRTRRFLES